MPAPKATAVAYDQGVTQLSVSLPTVADGDLIVARFACNTGSPTTITVPGYYTVVQDNTQSGNTSSVLSYKIASATESGSTLTATYGASSRVSVIVVVMAAGTFNASAPFAALAGVDITDTGATSYVSPQVSLTGDATVLVWDVQQSAGTAYSFTPPAGFVTAQTVSSQAGGGQNNRQAVAWKDGTAGAAGPYTSTWTTAGKGAANTVAIAAAGSAPPPTSSNVSVWDGTKLIPADVFVWDGAKLVASTVSIA